MIEHQIVASILNVLIDISSDLRRVAEALERNAPAPAPAAPKEETPDLRSLDAPSVPLKGSVE